MGELATVLWLAAFVACASWAVTEAELFRELREGLKNWACSRHPNSTACKKVAYLVTCYYCFSHYVTVIALLLNPMKVVGHDWRGYVLSWLCIVSVAAVYLTIYNLLRVALRWAKARADTAEILVKYHQHRREQQLQREDPWVHVP